MYLRASKVRMLGEKDFNIIYFDFTFHLIRYKKKIA